MNYYKNSLKILGKNVKYYRHEIKYSQETLAEKCNLSARYMSDIENGKGNVSIVTLERLAKELKVDTYILLKDRNIPKLPKRINMK